MSGTNVLKVKLPVRTMNIQDDFQHQKIKKKLKKLGK
jgi:hypothetical protein